MKVFISWSGKRSKAIAVALKEWLPLVIQYAKPWVSEKDISAGERWAQAIAGELESSNFGILCITPENIKSEWILFEAGALSKSMQDAKVIPLLFDLELSDLSGPLSQFQALKLDQIGILDVVKAINNISETKANDGVIEQLVPALWQKLEEKLAEVPEREITQRQMRPQGEVIEDLVLEVRGLSSRIKEGDFDSRSLERRMTRLKSREFDLKSLDTLMRHCVDHNDGFFTLLALAGYVRDRFPWLSDALIETHRELKIAPPDRAKALTSRLMRFASSTMRDPFFRHIDKNQNIDEYFVDTLLDTLAKALYIHIARRSSFYDIDETESSVLEDDDLT